MKSNSLKLKFLGLLATLIQSSFMSAQSYCTPTVAPNIIFYPHTTTTNTNSGVHYLCGPKTEVFDTLHQLDNCSAYLNGGSTLTINWIHSIPHSIWLKNNSVLNFPPGSNSAFVVCEPQAVINNTLGLTIFTCPQIIFPGVNCATDIVNNSIHNKFKVFPNPVSNSLTISLEESFNFNDLKLYMIEPSGQEILFNPIHQLDGEFQLDLKNLRSGIYFLNIFGSGKLIGVRKIVKE